MRHSVAQYQVGFGLNRRPEAAVAYYLKAPTGQAQFLLKGDIRVGHGPGAYHALFAHPAQRVAEQLGSVYLDLDVLEGVRDLIAPAPAVAVYAPVQTAAVYVHPGRAAAYV